ncbi:ABC transporter ATP-binding protein [Paenisporosarcina sp. TG20]|uniref:ABC transporter ATP-binding protein n=1 Tax=Paenisporosarcina sp. TG20 TaxID=1211706 RepID=UPI00030297FD|nr:dipeptide ABC transporter ATP-binding protein [Paenisporosarcina sp. TG20]
MPTLLKVNDLKKYFEVNKGLFGRQKSVVKAVDGINLDVIEGETIGLVGESGCGKSTTGRLLLRLIEADQGEIIYKGQDLRKLDNESLRKTRKDMQMVFQDPYGSLNPRLSVGEIIREPLRTHFNMNKEEQQKRVKELLDVVGLNQRYINRYPHEFSGGQRQRIGIARALALNPKLIIADEPVAALDVSIQAQVLNLLKDLQKDLNLTYIFIAHDLSVVQYISDRVAVMYLGKIVEIANSETLYKNPQHPYTKALLSSIPVPDPTVKRERILLEGDVPSPLNPPSGCSFHTRCPFAEQRCKEETPSLLTVADQHKVACHLVN